MIFLILLLVFNISLHSASGEFYFSEKNSTAIDKKIRAFAHEHNYTIELKKENSIEVYFDTPTLTLSTQNKFIKYQIKSLQHPWESKASAPNKTKQKSYQESILYLTKENTLLTYPIKHYHTLKSLQEKHPLLSLIKRENREDFLKKLKENGIKHPLNLKYIIKLETSINHYKLHNSRQDKLSILVNIVNIEKNLTTIEIKTFGKEKNNKLIKLNRELNLTEIKTNPYIFHLNRVKRDNFYFTIKVKYPYLFRLFNTVFISLFLVLFFYIFSTLFFTIFFKKTSYFD
jgi:hypothetical protein